MKLDLLHPARILGSLHGLGCIDSSGCTCTPTFVVHEGAAGEPSIGDNGANADDTGDSGAAANRIDSTIAPADQLSPGSVGVSRAIEGIVR